MLFALFYYYSTIILLIKLIISKDETLIPVSAHCINEPLWQERTQEILICLPPSLVGEGRIPCSTGAGGVGSIPANPDAQNVPSFRRWRFEMKLSPFFFVVSQESQDPCDLSRGGCGCGCRPCSIGNMDSGCISASAWLDETFAQSFYRLGDFGGELARVSCHPPIRKNNKHD
jgi:hypothetical protein